jgi:hypothetical protein
MKATLAASHFSESLSRIRLVRTYQRSACLPVIPSPCRTLGHSNSAPSDEDLLRKNKVDFADEERAGTCQV